MQDLQLSDDARRLFAGDNKGGRHMVKLWDLGADSNDIDLSLTYAGEGHTASIRCVSWHSGAIAASYVEGGGRALYAYAVAISCARVALTLHCYSGDDEAGVCVWDLERQARLHRKAPWPCTC